MWIFKSPTSTYLERAVSNFEHFLRPVLRSMTRPILHRTLPPRCHATDNLNLPTTSRRSTSYAGALRRIGIAIAQTRVFFLHVPRDEKEQHESRFGP